MVIVCRIGLVLCTHLAFCECLYAYYMWQEVRHVRSVLCTERCVQVAYIVTKKQASYAAIKEVSALRMEFLSNPSSGAALA